MSSPKNTPQNTAVFENKARSILRKLKPIGTQLLSRNDKKGGYGVYNRNKKCMLNSTIQENIVKALVSKNWVERVNGGYCISLAGEAWLNRQDNPEEPFRLQHQNLNTHRIALDDGTRKVAKVNECESPLDWLRRRKDRQGKPMIDDAQYQAGERLRRDFTFAHLTPKVTSSWSQVKIQNSVSSDEMRDSVMTARTRVTNALKFLGPEMSGIALDVCCYLKGLEESEKLNGWPQRSGKVVLQIALSTLARHYGLIGEAGNYRSKFVNWHSDDYRPDI